MTLRLVGSCPVCERQQKVTPAGAMVHHGYVRPGTGAIHGDCFGVGYPAYELSSEGCQAFQDALTRQKTSNEHELARLKARPEKISVYSQIRRSWVEHNRGDERYENALQYEIQWIGNRIREIEMARIRMAQLIQKWAPAPLLEIDEEGLTPVKRADREERKAERAAKRDEKDRKRAELRKKSNERLARKATTLLFFFDSLEALLAEPPGAERTAHARDLLFEAEKKKYGIEYPHGLWRGPDDGYGNRTAGPWGDALLRHAQQTLVDLGIAQWEDPHGAQGRPYLKIFQIYRSSGRKIRVPEPTGTSEDVLDAIAHMAPPGEGT